MLAGLDVLVVDNFCNSKASVLDRVERIVGRRPGFVQADLREKDAMRALFADYRFDAVSFCGTEGGGRIHGSAVALLRQQYLRQPGVV
jgi:UDP-glucose 4-epimerase